VLWWPVSQSVTPIDREINLNSTQFEFTPGRLEINQGDQVVITLTTSDVVHGFYLDGYDLETRVTPGISQRIEFVANQSGKFRFRCSISCGPLHPFMIGELIVSPNNPFWKAIVLMLVASAGMLTYLWNRKVEL
ncbi:MAG: cupredoxin domain-containing protein, partial [Anaerolineae bacterium]|nr:cupredoxin domain-containing protein [Anaerolineae bacterium]